MKSSYLFITLLPAVSSLQTKNTWIGSREVVGSQAFDCKCYDGEECWPGVSEWASLNHTVGGNLVRVVPPGSSCYKALNSFSTQTLTYDSAACESAINGWNSTTWHGDKAVDLNWPTWANSTCIPARNMQNEPCSLGSFSEYAIVAKTKEHIQAGVNFARSKNIRLVIRNTGHDFMGRSTGFGSLAINTHNFKNVEWIKAYFGPGTWTGGAVTVGSGIQTAELYKLAYERKMVVVGGECETVGLAGGYIGGGGHGPLTGFFGMGADQALSFDVVSAEGEFVTANPDNHADLYWALKGGGPSSFGVVVSVTIKAFPDMACAGTVFKISSTDIELYWKGFNSFHNYANNFTENGMYVWYSTQGGSLTVQPALGPNMTASQLDVIMKPLFDKFDADNVPYSKATTEYPSFYELYTALFAPDYAGASAFVGGNLYTKTDIATNGDNITLAMRQAVNAAGGDFTTFTGMGGHIVNPGHAVPVSDTAIHPAWREAADSTVIVAGIPGNANGAQFAAAQERLTNVIQTALMSASKDGAAYVNEADVNDPHWQNAFWGANYPRLLKIRGKWDPKGVFYAKATPGTEKWEVLDSGKLCRKV